MQQNLHLGGFIEWKRLCCCIISHQALMYTQAPRCLQFLCGICLPSCQHYQGLPKQGNREGSRESLRPFQEFFCWLVVVCMANSPRICIINRGNYPRMKRRHEQVSLARWLMTAVKRSLRKYLVCPFVKSLTIIELPLILIDGCYCIKMMIKIISHAEAKCGLILVASLSGR